MFIAHQDVKYASLKSEVNVLLLTYNLHAPKFAFFFQYKEKNGKVSIICGGGSGHEPFAAGLVGSGMLTAAVAGNIFASPPSQHILHAIKCVAEREGIIL